MEKNELAKDFIQLCKEFKGVQDDMQALMKRFHELHEGNNKHNSYVDNKLNKHQLRLNRQRDNITGVQEMSGVGRTRG